MDYFIQRRGQSFLALTFFIGGILTIAAVLIAFLALSYIDTGYGIATSDKAEATATAGAEDALLQLDRNAAFSSTSGYTVVMTTSTTATVTVTQNSPSAGLATILSIATVSGHTRKIDVLVSVNATTGQVSVISWGDIQ